MLTLLMPSTFATAKKVEPQKSIAEPRQVQKQVQEPNKKKESNPGGLSSVFHKLSEMAKVKEKELKKSQKEISDQEYAQINETPRFYQSENTEPLSITDVEAGRYKDLYIITTNFSIAKYEEAQDQEVDDQPKNFFNEIIKNIKPVTDDDSIDTSKYSSFVTEYQTFHQSKRAENVEGSKRMKLDEDSETTVIKLGGNQPNNE